MRGKLKKPLQAYLISNVIYFCFKAFPDYSMIFFCRNNEENKKNLIRCD